MGFSVAKMGGDDSEFGLWEFEVEFALGGAVEEEEEGGIGVQLRCNFSVRI